MGEALIIKRGYGYSTITFDVYPGLTRSTPTNLSVGRYYPAATSVGNYALFGGGNSSGGVSSSVVDAYNTSLVRSTPTGLSVSKNDLAATSVGNYALFGGGYTSGSSSGNSVVDVYTYDNVPVSLTVYPGTRYKLWDMQNELTATTMQTLTGSLPLTGYIKVKKATVD